MSMMSDLQARRQKQIEEATRRGERVEAGTSSQPGLQRAMTENERAYQEKILKKKQAEQLAGYDAESGKFYDQMRQGFRQRSQSLSSAQQTGAMNQLNQAGARAGISFSGIQQAAQANLAGQIGGAQVQAETAYDQRLNEIRESERNAVLTGQLDFFNQIQLMNQKADIDKEFLRFQADIADQYSSGWNDFFNVIGQGIGMAAGGPIGAAIGGRITSGGQQQYPANWRAY